MTQITVDSYIYIHSTMRSVGSPPLHQTATSLKCYFLADIMLWLYSLVMYIFITLLPSHSRLTSFSNPSIFSMMLLSICSFVSATKFHILSIFRISEKMHYIVRWLYCVVCYANVKVCDDNLFRTFN